MLIYLLCRPVLPAAFAWMDLSGESYPALFLREARSALKQVLPAWMVYSLPQALWGFAYAMIITGIWKGSGSPWRIFWYATIPILVLGFELLQIPDLLPGTYAAADLAAGTTGAVTGFFSAYPFNKIPPHENKCTT